MKAVELLTLTAKQNADLHAWIDEAREHESSMMKCAAALTKIRDSGYWRTTHDCWIDFCVETFSFTRQQAYEWPRLFQVAEGMKRISETTGEAVTVPKSLKQARKLLAQQNTAPCRTADSSPINNKPELSTNPRTMPARLEPESEPVLISPPAILQRPLTHFEVVHRLEAVERDLKSLLDSTALAASSKFRHALHEVQVVRASIQMELPGMALAESPRAKARGTLGEVQNFALSLALPESDGTSCFWKWESNGWKNGGEPIKDWKSTMRHWQAAGYMPSQRLNGQPKPETLADQSRRKIRQIVNEGVRGSMP